jgi:ABC-type transport system substrate-binding protein
MFWQTTENVEGVGLNFTSYSNPELDGLLDQAVVSPGCNPEEQAATYAQVQQIIHEDRPADFLFAPNHHIYVSDRLQGVAPGPFAPITSNVTGWYMAE